MQRFCFSTITIVLFLMSGIQSVKAQDAVFQTSSLTKTRLHPLKVEVSVYAKGGIRNYGELWKDTYHLSSAKGASEHFYGTYADFGVSTVFSIYDSWSIVGSIGYQQERLAHERGLIDNDGIRSHWLSSDMGINILNYVVLGVQTDFFLNSQTKSNGNIGYSGLGNDCFNSIALGFYAGIHFTILKFTAEFRYGVPIKNHLSADKLTYYNMERTRLKREYLELKLAYNLFTTKSRYNFFNME